MKLDVSILNYNFRAELARRTFADFIAYTKKDYEFNWHHRYLCFILDKFARGEIKKLMLFTPPQHGKSELVSRRLPPFLIGRNPNLKVAGASYAHSLATKFNREVQRIMTSKEYMEVFQDVKLNEKRVATDAKGTWLRNSEMFEIVGKQGSYLSVGVGGGLTGNRVDIMIIDDPVKDAVQASSPAFQQRNIEWYDSVIETRLHNDSQVIICMTRWGVDDLAGMILKREAKDWEVVSLPAIREDLSDPNDPREIGEAIWENRHSKEKILKIKEKSPKVYNSLYQQTPQAPDEILIFGKAIRVAEMPNQYERIMGIDFGFSNSQTAIADIEIDRKRKIIWAKEVFYEVGASNRDIAAVVKPYKLLTYCDSAEPKSISELQGLGVNALPAKKFPNSVLTQILFLQDFEIFYIGSNADFEKRHYQWQIGADGLPINQEIDKYNHFWKAVMYAVYTHLASHTPAAQKGKVKDVLRMKHTKYWINNV